MIVREKEIVKTPDFVLAATLFCLGHDVIGMDKTNPKRAIFYFDRTAEVEFLIKDFFSDKIKVSPSDFVRAQRELKAQLNTEF